MTDRVSIPARAFDDRKVKGSHLRVLAGIDKLGGGRLALSALYAETGIDPRELRRLVRDLETWKYLTVERHEGDASTYTVLFSEGGGEQNTPGIPAPPGDAGIPATPAPLSSPPKTPETPNTPPLIPPPDRQVARGTRLAKPFLLPDDWRSYAKGIGLLAIDRIAEDFADYWHARAGPNGGKLDWFATWRTWCRRERDRQGGNGRSGQASKPSAEEQRQRRQQGTLAAALAAGLVPARTRSG